MAVQCTIDTGRQLEAAVNTKVTDRAQLFYMYDEQSELTDLHKRTCSSMTSRNWRATAALGSVFTLRYAQKTELSMAFKQHQCSVELVM